MGESVFLRSYDISIVSHSFKDSSLSTFKRPNLFTMVMLSCVFQVQHAVWPLLICFIPVGPQNSKLLIISYFSLRSCNVLAMLFCPVCYVYTEVGRLVV